MSESEPLQPQAQQEIEEHKPEETITKIESARRPKESIIDPNFKKPRWLCPDCGKTVAYDYRKTHSQCCKGTLREDKSFVDAAKAAAKEYKPKPKPKKQLLSNLIRPEATLKETAPIKEEVEPPLPYVDDKRLNFYLQIAIVVGVVVTGLWVVYRSIINQPGDQAMPQQEIDMGFTDHRGVYYGPGEYHH